MGNTEIPAYHEAASDNLEGFQQETADLKNQVKETTEAVKKVDDTFVQYAEKVLPESDKQSIKDIFRSEKLKHALTNFYIQKTNAIKKAEKPDPDGDKKDLNNLNLTLMFLGNESINKLLNDYFEQRTNAHNNKPSNEVDKEKYDLSKKKPEEVEQKKQELVQQQQKREKESLATNTTISQKEEEPNSIETLYNRIKNKEGLSDTAFAQSYTAYLNAKQKGILPKTDILTIVDYSKSNTINGFFCINLNTNEVVYKSPVGHGKNSGGEYAREFSNKVGSKQSSVGLFITPEKAKKANTRKRTGLKLKGLEHGINDNAESRGIYLHNAPVNGSEGCITIPDASIAKHLNTLLAGGYPIYVYTDKKEEYAGSKLLEKTTFNT